MFIECPRCKGKGKITGYIREKNGDLEYCPEVCFYCDGKGWIEEDEKA